MFWDFTLMRVYLVKLVPNWMFEPEVIDCLCIFCLSAKGLDVGHCWWLKPMPEVQKRLSCLDISYWLRLGSIPKCLSTKGHFTWILGYIPEYCWLGTMHKCSSARMSPMPECWWLEPMPECSSTKSPPCLNIGY